MASIANEPAGATPIPAWSADAWRAGIYALAIVSYLLASLLHLGWLMPVASLLALASILVSLPGAGPIGRVLALLFLAGGYWMLWRAAVPWPQYLLAHGQMLSLLALFAVLPVLSVPVRLGQYGGSIETLLSSRISGVFQLNCVVTALAFLCGSFMSLAAVPIMLTSMAPVVGNYPLRDATRFTAVSATYGYVLPILWTPVSGVVGVVLQSLHLQWLSLLPALMTLSVLALLLNWAIFYLLELRGHAGKADPSAVTPASAGAALSHLSKMLLAIVLMVAAIGIIDHVSGIGMLTVVTLLAIPFALAWSMALGRGRDFLRAGTQQLATRLPRMADQFAIFLAAGFFVSAMHLSGADHAVNLTFLHLHDLLGTRLFLLAMPAMALAASFIGVHPMVAIALLGESLKPEALGIGANLLAITLIGSSVLTYMLGPFSGTLGLVQAITRVSSYRLALWNLPYALGYVALLAATILLLAGRA
jgi:hypothetical protein